MKNVIEAITLNGKYIYILMVICFTCAWEGGVGAKPLRVILH
jgi:hypothetical protein